MREETSNQIRTTPRENVIGEIFGTCFSIETAKPGDVDRYRIGPRAPRNVDRRRERQNSRQKPEQRRQNNARQNRTLLLFSTEQAVLCWAKAQHTDEGNTSPVFFFLCNVSPLDTEQQRQIQMLRLRQNRTVDMEHLYSIWPNTDAVQFF